MAASFKNLLSTIYSSIFDCRVYLEVRISAAWRSSLSSFCLGHTESEGVRAIIDFVSEAWFEVVKSGDGKHFIAGTRVEKMRIATAAIRYVSGYASKTDQTLVGRKVGRYWGVVAKQNIPWGRAETILLDEQQSKVAIRTMRRFLLSTNRQSRIRRVAKAIRLKPHELIGWGGWFERTPTHWGKHLRGSGGKMPQKLQLRNLRSMKVFLDADFGRKSCEP